MHCIYVCPDDIIQNVKFIIFSYPSVPTYVLGTQKNRLIVMVLLSTQNNCLNEK